MLNAGCVVGFVVLSGAFGTGDDRDAGSCTPAASEGTSVCVAAEVPFTLHEDSYYGDASTILEETTTIEAARARCAALNGCQGFCFSGQLSGGRLDIRFGNASRMVTAGWTAFLRTDLEDHAPRVPPRLGDSELRSTAPDVLPGVGQEHLHGLLGRLPNGSLRLAPVPLPPGGLSEKQRRDAHRGFCFNSKVSESLALDRTQRDVRSQACRAKHASYPPDLPSATVIFVFHNENLAVLLRSVHSVLNRSPPRLLAQVILVDDASTPDPQRFYKRHWSKLQKELTEYCRHLPKVVLVRMKERRGLMLARMEGAWRATGDVLIFLDSHIEVTPGWIEPLLARIKENRTRVLVPKIASIGNEDFVFRRDGGLGAVSFTWALGQKPIHPDLGHDGTGPARSPIMPGGLFASDRRWFFHLGGYDNEMRLYGGEEMEIGFRTWMCGGSIEHVPCSIIGHVFRTPDYWQGQVYEVPGAEILRNKKRAAAVWMDGYRRFVDYAAGPLPQGMTLGDLEPRKALRQKLKCRDFRWYLKNVAADVTVPKVPKSGQHGALRLNRARDCVDTLGKAADGAEIGMFPCHGQLGAQGFAMDGEGLLLIPVLDYKKCVGVVGSNVVVRSCARDVSSLQWSWDTFLGRLLHRKSGNCLQAKDSGKLRVETCDAESRLQKWMWT